MTNNFYTRSALTADAAEIADMQRDLAGYCGMPRDDFAITAQHVERIIRHDNQAYYFVAQSKHQIETAHESPEESPQRLAGMMLCHRIPLSWRGISGGFCAARHDRR